MRVSVALSLSSLCPLCLCGSTLSADAARRVLRLPGRRAARHDGQGPRRRAVPLRPLRLGADRRRASPRASTSRARRRSGSRGRSCRCPTRSGRRTTRRTWPARSSIAKDAALGVAARPAVDARGGAPRGPVFVVGDLPEVVEEEIDGDPVPVAGQAAGHDQRPHLPARGHRRLDVRREEGARRTPARSTPPGSARRSTRGSTSATPTARSSPRTTTPAAPTRSCVHRRAPTASTASASTTASAAAASATSTA